jgi:hypothetical protein
MRKGVFLVAIVLAVAAPSFAAAQAERKRVRPAPAAVGDPNANTKKLLRAGATQILVPPQRLHRALTERAQPRRVRPVRQPLPRPRPEPKPASS